MRNRQIIGRRLCGSRWGSHQKHGGESLSRHAAHGKPL
jgi:hypothetical protein